MKYSNHIVVALLAFIACFSLASTGPSEEPQKVDPPATGQKAIRVDHLQLLPGFAGEKIYAVPRASQGSWVGLCRGPGGSLFASDQGGAGIFQIHPPTLGDTKSVTVVEKVDVPVYECARTLLPRRDPLRQRERGRFRRLGDYRFK